MGNRRYLACKSLGWTEIPCIIIESTPEDNEWYMFIENIQRDDLSEVEKAEWINKKMSGHPTLSAREISRRTGLHHDYISRLLQLHGFPIEIKEEIKSGTVAADTIRSINKLETPEEQIKVVSHAIDNELNRKQVDETIGIIKDMPDDIRRKLTEEPEYTIRDAFVEAEVLAVEVSGEFHDGEITYDVLKPQLAKCKSMLNEDYIRRMRAIDNELRGMEY